MALKTGLLVGVAAALWTTAASAVSMSMNWIELGSIATVDACVAEGEATLGRNGLNVLDRTASAAWAEATVGDELYAIYCILDRGIAVITGSGDNLDSVDATVSRLFDSFGQGTTPGGKPR